MASKADLASAFDEKKEEQHLRDLILSPDIIAHFSKLDISYQVDEIGMFSHMNGEEIGKLIRAKLCICCKQDAHSKCSQCQCTYYCSKGCQTKDWEEHKLVCGSVREVSLSPKASALSRSTEAIIRFLQFFVYTLQRNNLWNSHH